MNALKRILAWSGGAAAGLLLLAMIAIWARPPEIIRVGANYSAKIVCSNVFLAGRDPQEVLRTDVQAPGHPLLRLMRVDVDRARGIVRAGLFGFIGGGLAVVRPDVGCAVVPDGRLGNARAADFVPMRRRIDQASWPAGDGEMAGRPLDAAVERLLADEELAGKGMRAIVVIHNGRPIAERYAEGFDRDMPQLGWSMTKSVTAGLIGLLVKDGTLALSQSAGWPGDSREHISVANLLSMTSGLDFNEGYGAVSDVTRMLYLEPDMAAFAGSKPLIHPPGTVWSYSSGTAVLLSRIFQDAEGSGSGLRPAPAPAAVAFIQKRLFAPLGMRSATMETDEHGTLVGSSYLYATPLDWARYGQFLLQDGVWNGEEILPPGYVEMMASPVPASGGEYGQGLVWRWATHGDKPGENPDVAYGIPDDAFWMAGHDGQYIAVVPSRQLVVVRLGLTPSREHYRPEPLVKALLDVLR